MVQVRSYYEILGVDTKSTVAEIKKAYKEKLLCTHPDKNRTVEAQNVSIEEIKEAYQVLVNPSGKENYDKELAESYKKQGFYNGGEGLEDYSLDEFSYDPESSGFHMDCPRCQMSNGFEFTDSLLEEHCIERTEGGFYVVVQCSACSLWLNVNFDVAEDYESS
ncbi:Jjj3p [Lachancea thermotolerans CBS 6340]|uniref:Diphthamide biosynthesis protein 4 n=1 Tax=Lachancea thermotolerans (strain ATCC 56472 / CBS 6340 / NRRL Y-8284) TaxID=559295 RepID=C5DKA9_LACTC|nr:KLTH0F03124p [Lachancea thermotolerans CBS 6340]CAR23910.1 KLTH0F03124p [Lachancea thermotolerans CBS 6340]